MNQEDYINWVLNKHLLTPAYAQLPKETALDKLSQIQTYLKTLVNSNKWYLTTAEFTYFQ
jgi:hypothetical protein